MGEKRPTGMLKHRWRDSLVNLHKLGNTSQREKKREHDGDKQYLWQWALMDWEADGKVALFANSPMNSATADNLVRILWEFINIADHCCPVLSYGKIMHFCLVRYSNLSYSNL